MKNNLTRSDAKKLRDKEKKIQEKKEKKEEEKKRRKEDKVVKKFFMRFFRNIFILSILTFVYAMFIGTTGIFRKEYIITNEKIPNNFDGINVVHISDIHYDNSIGKKELVKLVNKINDSKPDIIVFTGDLLDDFIYTNEQQIEIISVLSELNATIGKYAINGNHDNKHNYFNKLITDSGFKYLDNKHEKIYYKDSIPIIIAGVTTRIFDKDTVDNELEFLINEVTDTNLYKILLMHEPDFIDTISNNYFDLILSGHSHNGQINIPFLKGIVQPYGSRNYYKPYYKFGSTDLFISSGLGTTGIDIRLFNRPSFNLYRLSSK